MDFSQTKVLLLVIQTFIHTMIARTKPAIFPIHASHLHAAQAHQYSIRKILKYLHPFYIKDKKHNIKKIKSFNQTHK